MTKTPTPASHAVNTAPISADLRWIEQDARELPEPSPTAGMSLGQRIMHVGGRENAAGYIEFGSVAAVRALVAQVLRDLQARTTPAQCLHQIAEPTPATYLTEDAACNWAWDQVRQDVGTEGWTAGDSGNFFGFFLWGWNYRGKYAAQRAAGAADMQRVLAMHAAPASPAQQDAPAAAEVLDALNYVDDFIARCNGDDRGSCESGNVLRRALTATNAQAQQDAPAAVAVPRSTEHAYADVLRAIADGKRIQWQWTAGDWSDKDGSTALKEIALSQHSPERYRIKLPADTAAPASQDAQDARVQWWLATLDQYGNPTLTDGAHGDRAGADRAAYLIDALGVGGAKKYAVARVELSEPQPSADGVNHEAVAQCNRAALAARQAGGAKA
ncbi:hypothetical protein [Comamonas antarctica]|uniref:hypothetical protein n=1 Tax=Comamonas antarctica TaxID=2743470 RepID=UPI0028E957ED|nr:hypothetical protein [Comamonas antarctica]